jgi:hypothetical protein
MFETHQVSKVAAQAGTTLPTTLPRADRRGAVPVLREAVGSRAPRLPVSPALTPVLPDGLRRGSTVAVCGSVSLLLALLGTASADGAWCALVGMPAISAEAAGEFGIELSRLPLVPCPGSSWVAVVGALLDAVDLVVARVPARLADGDIRRLAARTRTRSAVFVPYLGGPEQPAGTQQWPHADIRLSVERGSWSGIGCGHGRLQRREVTVTAAGRGLAARTRSTGLWLPAASGGVAPVEVQPLAEVVPLTVAAAGR